MVLWSKVNSEVFDPAGPLINEADIRAPVLITGSGQRVRGKLWDVDSLCMLFKWQPAIGLLRYPMAGESPRLDAWLRMRPSRTGHRTTMPMTGVQNQCNSQPSRPPILHSRRLRMDRHWSPFWMRYRATFGAKKQPAIRAHMLETRDARPDPARSGAERRSNIRFLLGLRVPSQTVSFCIGCNKRQRDPESRPATRLGFVPQSSLVLFDNPRRNG